MSIDTSSGSYISARNMIVTELLDQLQTDQYVLDRNLTQGGLIDDVEYIKRYIKTKMVNHASDASNIINLNSDIESYALTLITYPGDDNLFLESYKEIMTDSSSYNINSSLLSGFSIDLTQDNSSIQEDISNIYQFNSSFIYSNISNIVISIFKRIVDDYDFDVIRSSVYLVCLDYNILYNNLVRSLINYEKITDTLESNFLDLVGQNFIDSKREKSDLVRTTLFINSNDVFSINDLLNNGNLGITNTVKNNILSSVNILEFIFNNIIGQAAAISKGIGKSGFNIDLILLKTQVGLV